MEKQDPNGRGSGTSFGDGAEKVVRHARGIGEELGGLAEAVGEMVGTARTRIDFDRRMREEPMKTLLIAAGIGYVAGGGFFTPFTGRMLRLGARLWLIPAVRNQLTNREELH